MNCRHCYAPLEHVFLDLGFAPPSNAYLTAAELKQPELYFPLKLHVCAQCWLVQTEDYPHASELFANDYAYFSSISRSWLDHAARYAKMIAGRLHLGNNSLVIEVAANDGYLLKNFVAAGVPCLGIEPTASTAAAAETLGIPVLREFFCKALAEKLTAGGMQADLVIANNVYAHVPDVNDFTAGLKSVLKPGGTITLEFAHLMRLIEFTQFDTAYHEHFSYFSLHTVSRIFKRARLRVWDLEELPTHGGSLRIYGCHEDDSRAATSTVAALLAEEGRRGLRDLPVYLDFQSRADRVKDNLVAFLIAEKRAGKRVAAYGAAAKGNTFLNYAGIRSDLLPYVCDAAPSKQGKFLPGSHVPVLPPATMRERQPDLVLILPWNIAEEVVAQHRYVREWSGEFMVAIPNLDKISRQLNTSNSMSRIYYTKPSITDLEVRYATDAARNGWGERCYEYIGRFEAMFREHLGVKYAIATSSCTGAMHMGLAALGIGSGDEVILGDINWIASAAPITYLGAKPVFVDILPDTWCLDPAKTEAAITLHTKAILAVHLYGNLCNMDALIAIGAKHGIPVIEDAAEALGSQWHGRRAGSMGKFGTFSFHGSKTLTTGEGGMFVTQDDALYEKVLTMSNHGRARGQAKQFWSDVLGFKYKMSNLQAAIGCAQMERIDKLIAGKRRVFDYYAERLRNLPLNMNPEPEGTVNGFWMPTLVVNNDLAFDRAALLSAFKAEDIDGRVFFWPLSTLPMFEPKMQNKVSYQVFERAINLPTYNDLTETQMDRVIRLVRATLRGK